MTAYRPAEGAPSPIFPKEWDAIEVQLNGLAAELNARFPNQEEDEAARQRGYAAWRQESIRHLPPGVFIWRDEFEECFKADFSSKALTIVDFDDDKAAERQGDRELTYTPLLSATAHKLVFEGFQLPNSQPRQAASGPVIVAIPSGCKAIPAYVIPRLIAEALYPDADGPDILVSMPIAYTDDQGKERVRPPAADDWALMNRMWADFKPTALEAEFERWRERMAVFDASPLKPDWQPKPAIFSPHTEVTNFRNAAMRDHYKLMRNAIASGSLRAEKPNHATTQELSGDTLIRVDDLLAYLAGFRFELQGENTSSGSASLNHPPHNDASHFPPEVRERLVNAESWNERELLALCLGVQTYADRDDIAPEDEREDARTKIVKAIQSGELPADPNPGAGAAERMYGGVWRIEPARAVRWALSRFPRFPEWLSSSKLREIYEIQDAEKQATGRYTLREAAEAITASGERVEPMLEKLLAAAKSASLAVYGPGENARHQYGPYTPVRSYHEEAYWSDLNAWLDSNEPRIAFRFPPPPASAASIAPPPDTSAAPGLTKRERQIQAIEAAADAKGFPRNAIPDGGKKALREYCKTNHSDLFGAGDSPFNDAWKEASPVRIAMANRATYAGK
ncbi:hypothetical protein [Cupriavidus campinensis]|uniref:Uncharacterized protein n=1 Tax=Cupriavidus campinensis TaxID=151783 RepID=A0AAE9HWB8_9BURK|nr:hypothetical protein [Cupriavidus campinensis]URF03347.1 hypothetical protein M5D45_12495 [Cupriavidus campinensis]